MHLLSIAFVSLSIAFVSFAVIFGLPFVALSLLKESRSMLADPANTDETGFQEKAGWFVAQYCIVVLPLKRSREIRGKVLLDRRYEPGEDLENAVRILILPTLDPGVRVEQIEFKSLIQYLADPTKAAASSR